MRAWEKRYLELQKGELKDKLEMFAEKDGNKTLKKDEAKEYERYKKIKDNMKKVRNILVYKRQLEKEVAEIKQELENRKSIENTRKKLEGELVKLQEQREKIEKALKNPNLEDEKRKKAEGDLKVIISKIDKNNKEFGGLFKDQKESELSEISTKELNAKKMSISTKISKCNMICNNLVQGYSWDSIDMKLEKWQNRKYTSSKETAEAMREAAKAGRETMRETARGEMETIEEESEVSVVEVSEFAQKHPRLAAIGNTIRNVWKKITGKKEKEQPENEVDEQQVENDEFRKYIKEIAEKGIKGVEKEASDKHKEELKAKREEFKKQAYEREARKFGETYAEKSYQPEDSER